MPALLTADQAGERRLSSAVGLRPFFADLDRLDNGQSKCPVRILQVGDSHTANDAFSGRMREALQARFGAAGRGWLPGGVPFLHYRPQLVSVAQIGWHHLGVDDGGPAEAIGMDATVAQNQIRDARMTLVSSEVEGFRRFAIEFVAQPNGGTLSIRVDQRQPISVSTSAATRAATRCVVSIGEPAHRVELRAVDERPVHLLGWTTERRQAGVIYENHGTIGATVDLLGRMNPATMALELSDSRPALIVVAFGTNEGFDAELDLRSYRKSFAEHIAALGRLAPQAAVLILGPPDGNLTTEAGHRACCTGPYDAASSGAWREPYHLAGVRCTQRAVAAEKGWAFWDWSQAMGGMGSMRRLVERSPPLALPDHMHLNKAGYAATADVLLFDLINEYRAWRSRRPSS